jgi:electron transfer flavoprotein alpha subunit
MATLLVAEHDNKTLNGATAKALTAAKGLGDDVHVWSPAKAAGRMPGSRAALDGVTKVLLRRPRLRHQLAEPMAALIVSLAGDYDA